MIHRSHPLQARASSSRSYADEAASAAGQALDSTREFAAQALDRAADKLRDLRHGMSDTTATAQRQVGRYAEVTRHYVADQPVRSALIAAAVGAALMAAILLARRQRKQSSHFRY